MKAILHARPWLLACASLSLLAACADSPSARFYVLGSFPVEAQARAWADDVAVGLGPVELPDYLDRPQIVTRSGENELHLAEFDRWGESLKDNVTVVLAEDLTVLLPSQRVSIYPWKRSTPIDYQLAVRITRFDRTEGGEAVLSARWSVLARDGKELLSRESRHVERVAGDGYGDTVAAMNRALGKFGREIAAALANLPTVAKGG